MIIGSVRGRRCPSLPHVYVHSIQEYDLVGLDDKFICAVTIGIRFFVGMPDNNEHPRPMPYAVNFPVTYFYQLRDSRTPPASTRQVSEGLSGHLWSVLAAHAVACLVDSRFETTELGDIQYQRQNNFAMVSHALLAASGEHKEGIHVRECRVYDFNGTQCEHAGRE